MFISDNQITSITGNSPVCFWFNGSFPTTANVSARTPMLDSHGTRDLDYLSKQSIYDSDSRILQLDDPGLQLDHPRRTRTSVFHFESEDSSTHSHFFTIKHHLSHGHSVRHKKKKPKYLKRSGALESLS